MKWLVYVFFILMIILVNGLLFRDDFTGLLFVAFMIYANIGGVLTLLSVHEFYSDMPRYKPRRMLFRTIAYFSIPASFIFFKKALDVISSGNWYADGGGRRTQFYASIVNISGELIGVYGPVIIHFSFGFVLLYSGIKIYLKR